ncbi:alanine racemase [Helicobacter sp. MIT 05-5293]|uniref:alanine racemase n=1 Tax=Helicobacter sp. MIT 05-5293 TaxID=1548149 RepID=UPI00051CEF80|nr:alanine racemase [Helicobacter sp. MIT 05-5293]TLD81706.1 alanine racemase [Helicobacter sp. MIT 05-5293]
MSEIILNSQAYKHNLDIISAHIGSRDKIAVVLKDNAYGHGLAQMSDLSQQYGIKNAFVKNYAEAISVKDKFTSITALYGRAQGVIPPNVAMVINRKEDITCLPPHTNVELKVNAGMNRNGIESDEIETFIRLILEQKLNLIGVFSHNGYGDDLDDEFHNTQKHFEQIKASTKDLSQKYGFPLPRFHSLNSSAAIRTAMNGTIDDDLVRMGIAIYGYLDTQFQNPLSSKLQKVASLWADKISQRTLKKGARIGYSGCSVLESDAIVSTYDIGYGDGLLRIDKGLQILTQKEYPILPRSSMDCFSCLCNEERICVFDDVSQLAKAFNTISYEILVRLSPFIKRTII